MRVFVEGGGDSKALKIRCQEAFRRLFGKGGFRACGSRNHTFDKFRLELDSSVSGYIGLLVDSEDPVADGEKPWAHLHARDGWLPPRGTSEDQACLMTTCMETWIAADRATLQNHFGSGFRLNSLPPLTDIERRERGDIQQALANATHGCCKSYSKGDDSFRLLGKLNPDTVAKHCPSFSRTLSILNQKG